jgi:hypothetical protein
MANAVTPLTVLLSKLKFYGEAGNAGDQEKSSGRRRRAMDFGIFYEIQVNSPLKHRERE